MLLASVVALNADPLPVPFQSEYQSENWSVEEGFPENSCSGIIAAPDGYLWLGTFRGLARFNGQDFKPWAPEAMPTLRSTGIISMYRDQRSRIWLSTVEGLVTNEGATWRRWSAAEGWDQPADYVRSYAENAAGDLVLTRFAGRVQRLEQGKFVPLPEPPGTGGTLAGLDAGGAVYFFRAGHAGWLADGAWQPIAGESDLGLRAVGATQSRDGHALILCRDELLRLRGGRVVSRVRLSQPITTFWQATEDQAGALWLSSVETGVFRIKPDGDVHHFQKADGLPHGGGTRIVHAADDGSVWIGSGVGGLTRFRATRFRYLGEEEGMGDREVLTLTQTGDGRILFAPYGSGLKVFDGTLRPLPVAGAEKLLCRAMLRTRDDQLWLAPFGLGLMRLAGGSLTPAARELFDDRETVHSLFEDSRGRLWVGGEGNVLVHEAGRFHRIPLPPETADRRPTLFAERRDGTVLLAEHHEIFAFDDNGLRPEPLLRLPADWRVSTVLIDHRDRLWIGTAAHGLSVYHEGRLLRLHPSRGLPGAAIGALIQDNQGFLWFGSGRSVVRADPDELWAMAADPSRQPSWIRFGRDDGMRSLDFPYGTQPNVLKDDRGRLWFALIRGAAMVDPATIKLNERPPRVVAETISFVPEGAKQPVVIPIVTESFEPVLPAGSHLIRIGYAALDYSAPRKQRFRVRLDGEWQDMQADTTVSFLQLPAGRHSLQIQASGSDGAWNRAGATLHFHLLPFYWQTGWFRGLLGLVFFGLVGGTAWFAADRRNRGAQEKRERERRLAEAQARLALVLENTSDFVAFADPDGCLVYVNRAGRALVGLTAEAKVRQTALTSILPAWARRDYASLALPGAMREGTWSGESALLHRDGREVPVSQVLIAHRAPDGTLDFTSMIARDISIAKRHAMVQDALRGLATSLTAALEPPSLGRTVAAACRSLFAHDAFFLVLLGDDGRITLTAYTEDTAPNESAPRPVAASIRTLGQHLQPVLRGEPLLVNREPALAPGASFSATPWGYAERRSLSIMYAPVRWEGRVIGIVSLQSYTLRRYGAADLEQFQTLANHCAAAIARINAEALLRKNEERLRLAMQTARMGSWEIDLATGRLLASPEAAAVYGVSGDALSGSSDNLLASLAPSDAATLRPLLQSLLDRATPEIDHIHRLMLPDGTERWLELKGRREASENAGPGRIIGVTADITSRQRAEAERAKLEEQLRQSQKLEAVGTLAGGIAHDFNNILTAILGNADLASFDVGPEHPAHEFLEKIKKSGQRARDLVRRILAFSRPHETHRQLAALPPVVEEVVKLMRSTIPASVEIAVRADPRTPLVEVDSTELHQVLLNLGTNAAHALGGRPGRIEFRIGARDIAEDDAVIPPGLKPGRYARIAVSDNGRGIPAEIVPRIFDPFFTTKGPGEGTGLGLSVAHGIVRASGGTITVTSAVGRGSVFELFLPATERPQPAEHSPAAAPPAAIPVSRTGQRLLLVDDEELLVAAAERILTRAGYVVTAFRAPAAALAAFRAAPGTFDLIVSDLSMPEMSGIVLATECLRLRPELPVILISGYLRTGDREAARLAGIRDIVEKPMTPHDLLPVIARLLDPRPAR